MTKRRAAKSGRHRGMWLALALLPGCMIVDEIARPRDDSDAASSVTSGGDAASSGSASSSAASSGDVASSSAGGGDGDAGNGDGGDAQGDAGGGEGASLSCYFDDVSHQLYCAGSPSGDGVYVHETWEYGFYPLPGYQYPAYFSQGPVNWYNCLAPAPGSSKKIEVRYWLTSTNGMTTAPAVQWIDCQ